MYNFTEFTTDYRLPNPLKSEEKYRKKSLVETKYSIHLIMDAKGPTAKACAI